jgi:hypothetical protein
MDIFTPRGDLVATEVFGLIGNASFAVLRGQKINTDGNPDSILPNFMQTYWDPGFLYINLPGIHKDWQIDFRV